MSESIARKLSDSDRLIQQLSAANEQLEQFAYVASHDLREPLRIIVSFTDLLMREYGPSLNDEARRYMEISRQAAKKMETMVTDLLDYGRLGFNSERIEPTNSDLILRQAVEALSESIAAARARITGESLPTVMIHPLRLLRLFQNLISNSLKYCAANVVPDIRVSAEEKIDHWLFSVTDNGIGIEPEYLEAIFEPFKRLHGEQYVGNGIGLAVCKRIVENMGGQIWAERNKEAGSRFVFTLPKVSR